jgi:hypothetical protein
MERTMVGALYGPDARRLLTGPLCPLDWCPSHGSPAPLMKFQIASNHIATQIHIRNNILTDRHYGLVTLKDLELPDDGFE